MNKVISQDFHKTLSYRETMNLHQANNIFNPILITSSTTLHFAGFFFRENKQILFIVIVVINCRIKIRYLHLSLMLKRMLKTKNLH